MAYRRALLLEEAARATLMCVQLGNTDAVFPPEAYAALHHG
jgi:L-fuculose-phosphate aldolase